MARMKLPQAATKWEDHTKAAQSADKYKKGMSEFLGITVSDSALPVKHWNSFTPDKSRYEEGFKRAYSA